MRVKGLEPPRLSAPEPKSGASANFATPAWNPKSLAVFRAVENSMQEILGCVNLTLMQVLEKVLGSSRDLIRRQNLDLGVAAKLAIDEVAESSEQALDELELEELALRELSGFGILQSYLDRSDIEEIWIN